MILNVINLILGIIGIYVSFLIYKGKKDPKFNLCPLDGHCENVLRSKYNKVIGINLEYWGMLYYGFISFGYLSFIINKEIYNLDIFLLILTILAFLFSIYLAFVQKFIIKSWCIWCLSSGLITFFIFVFSLIKMNII